VDTFEGNHRLGGNRRKRNAHGGEAGEIVGGKKSGMGTKKSTPRASLRLRGRGEVKTQKGPWRSTVNWVKKTVAACRQKSREQGASSERCHNKKRKHSSLRPNSPSPTQRKMVVQTTTRRSKTILLVSKLDTKPGKE